MESKKDNGPGRIVQIAVSDAGDNEGGFNERLLALTESGELWTRVCQYKNGEYESYWYPIAPPTASDRAE